MAEGKELVSDNSGPNIAKVLDNELEKRLTDDDDLVKQLLSYPTYSGVPLPRNKIYKHARTALYQARNQYQERAKQAIEAKRKRKLKYPHMLSILDTDSSNHHLALQWMTWYAMLCAELDNDYDLYNDLLRKNLYNDRLGNEKENFVKARTLEVTDWCVCATEGIYDDKPPKKVTLSEARNRLKSHANRASRPKKTRIHVQYDDNDAAAQEANQSKLSKNPDQIWLQKDNVINTILEWITNDKSYFEDSDDTKAGHRLFGFSASQRSILKDVECSPGF